MTGYDTLGWAVFPPEPSVADWASHALAAAWRVLRDPAQAHQYACERTWFVGLDALANDDCGRLPDGPPLRGAAVDFVRSRCGVWPALHPAQLSAVFPGYPRPRQGESDSAFRYRRIRHAAHVDGVMGEGAPKRRFVREPHAFILGLPLTPADTRAAPLMVWEGSHRVMQKTFRAAFATHLPAEEVDVTEVYIAARRRVFARCRCRPVVAPPGSAILLHRLTLHGIGPFETPDDGPVTPRITAYFRPPMPQGARAWATTD